MLEDLRPFARVHGGLAIPSADLWRGGFRSIVSAGASFFGGVNIFLSSLRSPFAHSLSHFQRSPWPLRVSVLSLGARGFFLFRVLAWFSLRLLPGSPCHEQTERHSEQTVAVRSPTRPPLLLRLCSVESSGSGAVASCYGLDPRAASAVRPGAAPFGDIWDALRRGSAVRRVSGEDCD